MYMFTIKKEVTCGVEYVEHHDNYEEFADFIEAEVEYDEIMPFVANLINSKFFDGSAKIEHLLSFIAEMQNEEELIDMFNKEVVEEFDKRGYFN